MDAMRDFRNLLNVIMERFTIEQDSFNIPAVTADNML